MNSQLWWYTARSAGVVSWVLLAASVILGLALSTKALGRRARPNWLLDLHRFLGGAAVVFVGVHVVSIMLDSYVHFGLVEVLVPFTGSWHPAAVAWGIVGLYLLLAVEVTSLLRKRLSKRAWRLTHFLSFPLFVVATVHVLAAGTDRRTFLLRAVVASATIAIAALTAVRVAQASRTDTAPPRTPGRPGPAPARERRELVLAGAPVGTGGPSPTDPVGGASLRSRSPTRPRGVTMEPLNRRTGPVTPESGAARPSRRRRPHPARGARRLAGAASAVSLVALTGALAIGASQAETATSQATAQDATVTTTSSATTAASTTATTAATRSTTTTAVAATPSTTVATATSKGS